MTDRELRHLNKGDLIDIIYQMKKNEAGYQERIAELEKELSARELKISRAGSIAEAALTVNGVLEAAQKAADDYLAEIVNTYGSTKALCEKMLQDTAAKCRAQEQAAEKRCRAREQAADREIEEKWSTFIEKGQKMLNTSQSLIDMLK